MTPKKDGARRPSRAQPDSIARDKAEYRQRQNHQQRRGRIGEPFEIGIGHGMGPFPGDKTGDVIDLCGLALGGQVRAGPVVDEIAAQLLAVGRGHSGASVQPDVAAQCHQGQCRKDQDDPAQARAIKPGCVAQSRNQESYKAGHAGQSGSPPPSEP